MQVKRKLHHVNSLILFHPVLNHILTAAEGGGYCCSIWCCLLVVLCLLGVPIAMNFQIVKKVTKVLMLPEAPFGLARTSSMEDYFTTTGSDTIGSQIQGASKDEVVGFIKAGKNCATMYNDDPNTNEQAIATRICPELHDSDIVFHVSGVFGTHPNKNLSTYGAPRIKFVVSGTNVWTTFFDQHNSTRQMYTVPPSLEVNMSTLTGSEDEFLPDMMDTVKVVHSLYFIQRTRGRQVSWPMCASFYASHEIIHSTHGYLVCRENRKSRERVIDKSLMESLGMVDGRGFMHELAFVVPGPGVSLKISFEQDPDSKEPLPLTELLIRPGRTSLSSGNQVFDSEDNEGAEWKLRPKQIVLSYADGGAADSR